MSERDVVVEVRSSAIHGFGLFAATDIPWGTKICQYVGEIISDKQAEERIAQGNDYIFELDACRNIDGSSAYNIARYANHRRLGANAFVLRDRGEIWLVAGIEGISKDTEIVFDYGSDYY